jgi:hypothetical protein
MLSQHDRHRLEAIEQQLERDDPDLAHHLATWPPSRGARGARRCAAGIVVLSALGLLLGLTSVDPLLMALSVPCVLVGWAWLIRLHAGTASAPDTGESP